MTPRKDGAGKRTGKRKAAGDEAGKAGVEDGIGDDAEALAEVDDELDDGDGEESGDEETEAPPPSPRRAEPKRFAASEVSEGDLDATRLYLNEIGFSPLLSAEEEVYFARLAQKGEEAARKRMI